MSDNTKTTKADTRDWGQTLYLPQTQFPMRAGLPEKEPQLIKRWDRMQLYQRLRQSARGKPKYVLHDGPPYANGHLHIGHALNKILKDVITRSFQMSGFDANYVPGWDCHGLPIEWKIEEQYREKGLDKNEVPVNEFRRQCREFAQHWIGVQSAEFRRLGVEGDFENPYTTMAFKAEAKIAAELMKFAMSGQLYRGSKPVMWSVVERTALAEAEVEYQDYESDTVWVKFPVVKADETLRPNQFSENFDENISDGSKAPDDTSDLVVTGDSLLGASVVIWTTTPWTIPGNRAISYSSRIGYGLFEVTAAANAFGPQPGEKLIFADKLAEESFRKAKLEFKRVRTVESDELSAVTCSHPLAGWPSTSPLRGGRAEGAGGGSLAEKAPPPLTPPLKGEGNYSFDVPLFDGGHVTDDAGTGFVHTAPGHGREDFDIWMEQAFARLGHNTIPFTVDDAGFFTRDAPGFGPDREGGAARVIDDNGKKGDANQAVITALIERGMLFARGRLKHTYPHSWRSKKPVIFRNTPQWFVYMDKPIPGLSPSPLRGGSAALAGRGGGAITHKSPPPLTPPLKGEGDKSPTLRSVALQAIDDTRFVPAAGQNRLRAMIENRPDWVLSRQRAWGVPIAVFADDEGNVLKDEAVNARITQAFEAEGADAWFADGARERFLGSRANEPWKMVTDILDVWFDSGSTHAFCLEEREDLKWPADLYLEGSDQHRGWFHSSLLESCGTRGRAPYDAVLTHGFVMDEEGRKMSKSLGNVVTPQKVIEQSGADILRLWVASSDYSEDLRIGPEILKTAVDAYRKLRNTFRWMLGTLAHDGAIQIDWAQMPELERLMLHRLAEIDVAVREGYDAFDFKRIVSTLSNFMGIELSAFYFDIRKDALYCDAPSSIKRQAALQCVRHLFDCLSKWLAPLLPFTMEEAWLDRHGDADTSIHLEQFPVVPAHWLDQALAEKWTKIRKVRRVVTGALEIERKDKRIGSSLEAAPVVHIGDSDLMAALAGLDFAEICITSQIVVTADAAPANAFRIDEIAGVAVVPLVSQGRRCARSWKTLPDVGTDPEYGDLSLRDAAAMREIDAMMR